MPRRFFRRRSRLSRRLPVSWNAFAIDQAGNLTVAAPGKAWNVNVGSTDWLEANDVTFLASRGMFTVQNVDVAAGVGIVICFGLILVPNNLPLANVPNANVSDEQWFVRCCLTFVTTAAPSTDTFFCEFHGKSKRRLQQPTQTNVVAVASALALAGSPTTWASGTFRFAAWGRQLYSER